HSVTCLFLRRLLAGWSSLALEQSALVERVKELPDLLLHCGIVRQQGSDLNDNRLAAHCTIPVIPDQRAEDAQHMPLVGCEVLEQSSAVREHVRLDIVARSDVIEELLRRHRSSPLA